MLSNCEYHKCEIDEIFEDLNSSASGLSLKEAESRLDKYGKNELEKPKSKPLYKSLIDQIIDPMIIMLLCAAAVSGLIAYIEGESFADVIIILAVVIINAALGVYQESKSEQALEALQDMTRSTTKVMRDGVVCNIDSCDVVVGDVVLLEAGDSVAADGRLIENSCLKIDESALTGESVPVDKCIELLGIEDKSGDDIPLADRTNMAYSGTVIVYGRGAMIVTATGMDTEIGKIASALTQANQQQTPLQKKMAQLSKTLTKLVIGICIAVFAFTLLRSGGINAKIAIDAFMIAVSLAVAAIPEGLPAIVTVVLSIGVTNMSKKNAIVRKLSSVETLGCAQIICSDKTGTLTQNKMTVVDDFCKDKNLLLKTMVLCNECELSSDGSVIGEPTEVALVEWGSKNGIDKNNLESENKRIAEIPFDSVRKMMTTFNYDNDAKLNQYTKGALDVVLDRCSFYWEDNSVKPITDDVVGKIKESNSILTHKALRVLACATKFDLPNTDIDLQKHDSSIYENNLVFVGLVGMIDPVRPEVNDAIKRCKTAGIKPIMITGDHIDTAKAIAKEINIYTTESKALTGNELTNLSDKEFSKILSQVSVYARVQPEHKTRIVKAWQDAGYVVAMTGDGVNDAPSIKNADIGVGMGITGTDVTKNVADMILADDNFATIVNAVEEGRTIYDNILKAIQFLLSSNISEVLSVFFASLAGFTILKPVHLLFINLVTDTFPALALGFEKPEQGIMQRKPRDSKKNMFAGGMGFDIVYQGISVTVLCLISWFIGLYVDTGSFVMQNSKFGTTMAFLTMCMVAIFHSINMRSLRGSIFKIGHHNWFSIIAACLSLIFTTIVCEVPMLASVFDFASVDIVHYLIAIGLGVLIIPIVEIVKFIQRKTGK